MVRANEYDLERVKDIVRQSDVLKSRFKSEVSDEVYGKRNDLKDAERKLSRKIK